MTTLQHHVVTQSHSSSNQLDNHLDALLDDLQTSVSRPGTSMALSNQNGPVLNGSAFGGQISLPPGASGYREITTTVTRDTNGVPTTSREYQIEYLNPANSVTVLDDRSSSPAMDLLKSGDLPGHQLKSYKTEVYDYKFSKTTSDRKVSGYGGGGPQPIEDAKSQTVESKSYRQSEPQDAGTHFSRTENFRGGETNVSKNLNELDMLLKELNNPPTDAGSKREHVQTIEVERGGDRYNESMPRRSASASREMTYTERSRSTGRAQSPPTTPKAPARTVNVQREYNTMESRSHTSRRDGARSRSTEMSPTLRRRTPSPSSGDFRPSNFSNYPLNPRDLTPSRTISTKTYNYSSSSAAGRATPTPTSFEDPQPYRSPSPVSFPQRRSPSPARKSLNRSDSGRTVSYQVSPPVSENPTVITYKYSSHSREQSRYPGGAYDDQDDSVARPFPTSTPIPAGEQSPPKKLDELMASFQDSKGGRSGGDFSQGSSEYRHQVEYSSERHGGELQRSPSFERNLRPSNVKMTQSYSPHQQQEYQQNQQREYQQSQQREYQQSQQREYQQRQQSQQQEYQQREFQQQSHQYKEQPGAYHREYQRKEEYHTSQHPGQLQQQKEQGQFQREQGQLQREQGQFQREQGQLQREQGQLQREQGQFQREQHQQSQYQQHQQSQGGFQREAREQYQQSQSGYHQNQAYQQYQQYQQNQIPVNESMSSGQAYRATSATRSVAGPPVYYPPGVELFTKKEEAMLMQEQSSGGGKGKSKSKSKSEKSKDKSGKKGVPVCLPVCCAIPCSIM